MKPPQVLSESVMLHGEHQPNARFALLNGSGRNLLLPEVTRPSRFREGGVGRLRKGEEGPVVCPSFQN